MERTLLSGLIGYETLMVVRVLLPGFADSKPDEPPFDFLSSLNRPLTLSLEQLEQAACKNRQADQPHRENKIGGSPDIHITLPGLHDDIDQRQNHAGNRNAEMQFSLLLNGGEPDPVGISKQFVRIFVGNAMLLVQPI